MRRTIQGQLAQLAAAACNEIGKIKPGHLDKEETAVLLAGCLQAVGAIEHAVNNGLSKGRQAVYGTLAQQVKDDIGRLAAGLDEGSGNACMLKKAVQDGLCGLEQEIRGEQEIEYVVLFLPYKASMWDSMESIWISAKEDPRCIVYTMPIPYYDKHPDGSFGQMHNEAGLLPDYVETAGYQALDLERLHPDVVYIHNPYDQYNYVTSVHPAFYSSELKKYTDMLVYVHYSIPGVYESVEGAASFCQVTGMYRADLIIAQSQVHKTLLAANGHRAEKIAVLGNPKFDYVLHHLDQFPIPEGWGKLNADGRKTALVCISIGAFLTWDKIIELYDTLVGLFIHRYHMSVIYRPHPLLEATIQSMRPQKYVQYQSFLDKYRSSQYFVEDGIGSPMAAISASDCMVGDYSSLCFSYAATGKPVAITVYGKPPFDKLYYALDYRGFCFIDITSYLLGEKMPTKFEEFAEDVINGIDRGKEKRMSLLRNSVVNLDGTCGQKIHSYVMQYLHR